MKEANNDIGTLREALFAQLRELRAAQGEGLRDAVTKARAVSDLAGQIIDSARVEVDYMKVNRDAEGSAFFDAEGDEDAPLPAGITGIVRHRIGR